MAYGSLLLEGLVFMSGFLWAVLPSPAYRAAAAQSCAVWIRRDLFWQYTHHQQKTPARFAQAVKATAWAGDKFDYYSTKWFKVVTPIASNPNTFLDVWCNAGAAPGTITDTEIAIFDNSGNKVTENDDGGPGAYSCLTYGRTTAPPARTRDGERRSLLSAPQFQGGVPMLQPSSA